MDKQYFTLDEVVAEAMTTIKLATDEEKLYMKQWAYRALKEIGPGQNNIEVCTLYPENLVLRKPDNYYKAISIGLFDTANNEYKNSYRSGVARVHQSRNVYTQTGVYVPEFNSIITISEDEFFFYLSSEANAITYALLRYFKMPIDENGNLMFPEYSVEAVGTFIQYKWAQREEKGDWRDYLQSWKASRAEARGRGKLPNGLLYKQLAKEWNSMIQKTNFDRF
jgi:hypothetical protein